MWDARYRAAEIDKHALIGRIMKLTARVPMDDDRRKDLEDAILQLDTVEARPVMVGVWFDMDRLGDVYAWNQGVDAERQRISYLRRRIRCMARDCAEGTHRLHWWH